MCPVLTSWSGGEPRTRSRQDLWVRTALLLNRKGGERRCGNSWDLLRQDTKEKGVTFSGTTVAFSEFSSLLCSWKIKGRSTRRPFPIHPGRTGRKEVDRPINNNRSSFVGTLGLRQRGNSSVYNFNLRARKGTDGRIRPGVLITPDRGGRDRNNTPSP